MASQLIAAPRAKVYGRFYPVSAWKHLGTILSFQAQQEFGRAYKYGIGSIFPYESIETQWRGSATARALVLARASVEDAFYDLVPRPDDLISMVRRLLGVVGIDLLIQDKLLGDDVVALENCLIISESISLTGGSLVMRDLNFHLTRPF